MPLGIALAITGPILLLYPYGAIIDLLVATAEHAAGQWVDAVSYDERDQHAEAVHSSKADIRGRQMFTCGGDAAEAGAYEHAMLAIERARRQILRVEMPGEDQTFEQLWSAVNAIRDGGVRSRIRLSDRTGGSFFGAQSVQIIQFALIDLVGNALRATREGSVDVLVQAEAHDGQRVVTVMVDDDGDGLSTFAFPPESSVATLRRICQARAGDVLVGSSPRGGVRATAQFCDEDHHIEIGYTQGRHG